MNSFNLFEVYTTALMGVCRSACCMDPCHEHTKVVIETRSEDSQQRAKKRWRCWCQLLTLFLFLILATSVIILEADPSQFSFTPKLALKLEKDKYFVEYPHEYHFVINEPEKCKQQKPFLVLMVPVAPQNRVHRNNIRSTWGNESTVLGKVVKLFFLLGLPTGKGAEQVQQQVLQESREHQDLIQSDFVDCYKNLTIKTMMILEWLVSYCSSASYAMKIDSDTFLNLDNLINMLLNAPKINYMTGMVECNAVVSRDPSSKWYLPVEVFPEPKYPCYSIGMGYILSLDLPRKVVDTARHIKALYIEDVYLGMCMKYLGILPTRPPDLNYFHYIPVLYDRCAYSKLITTTTYEHIDHVSVWKDFKRSGPFCVDEAQ